MKYHVKKQIATLPPDFYTQTDLDFIVPRVLELTYTANDLRPWAHDLGYDGSPFFFDPDRRGQLRAELDAWYAKAYGLTRDELRYILAPADVMGDDYPSETFRVLKNNEIKEFGYYRTGKLVLQEFDRMTLAEESGISYQSLLVPPPGQQVSNSFSPQGIIRDLTDARMAGFLLVMIRESASLTRQQLSAALLIASRVEPFAIQLDDSLKAVIARYRDSGMFGPERIDRIQSILRYFEDIEVIRINQQGEITSQSNITPDGLVIETDMTSLAPVLLHAADEQLRHLDRPEADDDSQPSTKFG